MVMAAPDEVDVLVAGSGIAGMAAAYETASRGRRVLVVEAFDEPGGASAISGGASCIVGTPVQEAAGVCDSVELALEDWARCGGPTADLEWARRYLAASRREVYDWCVELGIGWEGPGRPEHNSVARGHRPAGGGRAITAAVTAAALRLGVRLLTGTRLLELPLPPRRERAGEREPGAATTLSLGAQPESLCHSERSEESVLRVRMPHCVRQEKRPFPATLLALSQRDRELSVVLERAGSRWRVQAKAVVMATGGFVNNQDMLRAHAPLLRGIRRFLSGGGEQALGSGHQVLAAAGADFAFLENVWIYPDGTPNPRCAGGQRAVLVRGGNKTEVWLNERGERFHNEQLTGGASGTPALLAQPGQHCWAIFDRATASRVDLRDDGWYGSSQNPNRPRIEWFFETSEYVRRADGIAELARSIGLPDENVRAEVEAFNAAVAAGAKDRFGRSCAERIAVPPFYAVEYLPTVQKNLGGVKTDLDCRVLSGGRPIPGLFAAGELAGMAGGHINGSAAIENTMFAPSLYSGRVAGRAAASVA